MPFIIHRKPPYRVYIEQGPGGAMAHVAGWVIPRGGAQQLSNALAAYLKSLALIRGHTYVMIGTKLNGLSQATAYGDDLQNATNYPIVRLTNVATGHVFYCRTHGHSTMAVGYTGPVKTNVDIPADMETGPSYLEVVANGIPSERYTIQIQ